VVRSASAITTARTITVIAPDTEQRRINVKPKGPSQGDLLVFAGPLRNAANTRTIGRIDGTCVTTSSSSVLSCGVEVLELDAGVLGGEAPVDPATGPVACRLPGRDLPLQGRPISQAAVQALPGQHGQLDLGHVQPAAVLGVEGSSSRSASRLASAGANASYSDTGVWVLGVVLDQPDPLGVRVVDIDQVPDGSVPSRCGCAGR